MSSSRARIQPRTTVVTDQPPSVMAGRHGIALVQVARPAEQRPELHVRIAVDAWARRPAIQVRVEERLEDAGIELPLEVHHVERDAELAGDPAGVIGGVERAAALLELGVRVGYVVQAHPHADDLVALGVQDRRRDRGIDPAGHRDQDPAQTPTPWPSGSRATESEPICIEAMTRGTTSAAVATRRRWSSGRARAVTHRVPRPRGSPSRRARG